MKKLRLILVGGSLLLLVLGGVAFDAPEPIPVGGCDVYLPAPIPIPTPTPTPTPSPTPYPAN